MKPELLATLRAAGEVATKGPWATEERNDGKEARVVISGGCIALLERYDYRNLDPYSLPAGNDAEFIALARNHWGELLDEIERLRRDLENAEIRREHAEKRAREYLLEWQEDDDSRADVLEATIDENLPEYVLDDGTEEPANYLERIEFAGQEARRAIKYRDERDALRARAAKLDAVAEAARDFASWKAANGYDDLLTAYSAETSEANRLRKLFDDAGQGEHNVLALVDHYQRTAMEADERLLAARKVVEEARHKRRDCPQCGVEQPADLALMNTLAEYAKAVKP